MKKKNLELLARLLKAEKNIASRNAAEALNALAQEEKKLTEIRTEIAGFHSDAQDPLAHSAFHERYSRGAQYRKSQSAIQVHIKTARSEQAREKLYDCIREEKALDTLQSGIEKRKAKLKENHEENATEDFFRGRHEE